MSIKMNPFEIETTYFNIEDFGVTIQDLKQWIYDSYGDVEDAVPWREWELEDCIKMIYKYNLFELTLNEASAYIQNISDCWSASWLRGAWRFLDELPIAKGKTPKEKLDWIAAPLR